MPFSAISQSMPCQEVLKLIPCIPVIRQGVLDNLAFPCYDRAVLIHLAWAYSARQRRLIAATASQSAERISNADVLDKSALYRAATFALRQDERQSTHKRKDIFL
jgi:hypothetical protein